MTPPWRAPFLPSLLLLSWGRGLKDDPAKTGPSLQDVLQQGAQDPKIGEGFMGNIPTGRLSGILTKFH